MTHIKLGFAPTRRSIFSAPDAVKYRNLTANRLLELCVDFVDIEDINPEGLLYDENDRLRILEKFKAAGEDGLFLPHCNFCTEYLCARLSYYCYERQQNDATAQDLLQYHEVLKSALGYAVDLGWIQANPADQVNPCVDEAPILFTDFILEWLEMMRSRVEVTTYSAYAASIKGSIVPYFKDKKYTLQDLEKHPKYIQDDYQYQLTSGLTANTVIHRHANIRKCLQYPFQIGLIKSNPADRIERPRKAKYVATIYNQQELEVLFQAVKGDPIELGVILAAFYGLRRSEIIGLKWDAIDFEKNYQHQAYCYPGQHRRKKHYSSEGSDENQIQLPYITACAAI